MPCILGWLQRLKRNLNKGITMEQILKTTTRATNPCDRDLTKSVTYLLRLDKIALISSLKSAIITAITEMNKLRKSIMDSFKGCFLPHTQLNSQKKSPTSKRSRAYTTFKGSLNLFYYHLVKMDRHIITQRNT